MSGSGPRTLIVELKIGARFVVDVEAIPGVRSTLPSPCHARKQLNTERCFYTHTHKFMYYSRKCLTGTLWGFPFFI